MKHENSMPKANPRFAASGGSAAVEEAVAKAMWDAKIEDDDSPKWDELNPHMDAGLKKEIVAMAKAGIAAYEALRQNDQAEL